MSRLVGLLASLFILITTTTTFAQNPTCPTRPNGDTSNACASTAFVQGNTPGQPTALANQIPVFPGGGAAPVPTSATTWFDNAYCNTVGFIIVRLSGAWTCQQGIPVNINWFSGVDPTGVSDSTTGIQNVINALPASGGRIYCTGNYKISSTLTMGNGSGAAGSTTQGFIFEGVNNPTTPITFGAFTTTSGCKLTWAGGASDMMQIKGPLQGWGVRNVYFNCAGSTAATNGLHVTSAQWGDSANLTFNGCSAHGVLSDTVAIFGSFTNTDSTLNKWWGINVQVPNTTGAVGIALTGASGNTNTNHGEWHSVVINFLGNCSNCVGLQLADADSEQIYTLMFPNVSGANVICVMYDYSVSNVFPASTSIYGVDTGTVAGGGCGTPYLSNGTPGAGAKPNYLYGVVETDGGVVPTTIPNIAAYGSHDIVLAAGGNVVGTAITGAWSAFTPSPSCGTATFTTNVARSKTMGKTTWVTVDIAFTAVGTCTTGVAPAFTFNLPNNSNNNTELVGREFTNNSAMIGCTLTANNSAVLDCVKNTTVLVNWAANDRMIVSGVYENQ